MDKRPRHFPPDEMIRLTTKSFIIQKEAESREDCQDACRQNKEMARYAVADGATQSFFPKEWADLLVEHFCEASVPYPTKNSWRSWIKPVQEKWHVRVARKVEERDVFFLNNPFNFKQPAASTFIGVEFDRAQANWQAMIVGDSCIFHLSACEFRSYVIEKSTGFTNRPRVFASYDKDNNFEPSFVKCDTTPGDTIILATDALAQWILRNEEAGRRNEALGELKEIENENQFHEFVHRARTDEYIHLVNDDVTLMIISVEEDELQAGLQSTATECPAAETSRQQSEWSPTLLWTIVAVIVLPVFFYMYWLLFFSHKDA